MEGQQIVQVSHDVESEEITDSFVCCVCLDLLYKPIVLPCGHIICFWCVNTSMSRSMSDLRQSYCPLCRHMYNHFPTICQMLHFLLLKKYPIAYKRRELEIMEEEKKCGCFSPQFDAHVCSSQANQDSNVLGNSDCGESCAILHGGDYDGIGNVIGEEKDFGLNSRSENCSQISVADVLCAACKQLLFHPVVLNCGHVYCESCMVNPDEQMVRCKVCPSSHPSGFPKVCSELGHFLEEQFPKEYALRRDDVQQKKADFKHGNPIACATKAGTQGENLSWLSNPFSKVNLGVGCDSCGMYPIIGDRYKCLDCFEKMGFDLCSHCYKNGSKLPGRFNQQHTPEHRFELIHTDTIRNHLRRLTGGVDESSLALMLRNITLENSSEGITSPTLSTEARENE